MNEEEMWELDAAANAAIDEVALNDRVFKAVEDALGRIAREHYPALGNWQPEQLRKLADKISRVALKFTLDLCELDFAGQSKE